MERQKTWSDQKNASASGAWKWTQDSWPDTFLLQNVQREFSTFRQHWVNYYKNSSALSAIRESWTFQGMVWIFITVLWAEIDIGSLGQFRWLHWNVFGKYLFSWTVYRHGEDNDQLHCFNLKSNTVGLQKAVKDIKKEKENQVVFSLVCRVGYLYG